MSSVTPVSRNSSTVLSQKQIEALMTAARVSTCEYCCDDAEALLYSGDLSTIVDGDGRVLIVYHRGKKLGTHAIKYCPMCGRRLEIDSSQKGWRA